MSCGIILNVRGCNASGKTTAVREFIKRYNNVGIEIINGNVYTKCSDSIYVLGRYDKKNGGCDGYNGREHVISAIHSIIREKHPHIIIYEGMLYSKTFKMAADIDAMFRSKGYRYSGIYLHRPFSSIIRLLEARNDGADYNIENIWKAYDANENTYRKIKAAGIDIEKIDADKVPFEQMGDIITDRIRGV